MKTKIEFNLEECPLEGTNLIEASAGTGKTYTIVRLFLRFLLEPDADGAFRKINEILVVTFTNAATEELRERVREYLQGIMDKLEDGLEASEPLLDTILKRTDRDTAFKLLTAALRNFDEARIFTIHGFCRKAISEFAFETGAGFDSEFIADQLEIFQDVVLDFWRNHLYAAPAMFVNYALESGFTLEDLTKLAAEAQRRPGTRMVYEQDSRLRGNYKDILALQKRVGRVWKQKGPEIEAVLLEALERGALSKTKFKPEKIARAREAMDSWVRRDYESPALFQAGDVSERKQDVSNNLFKYFRAEYVAAGTKKKETPPEHEFFDLCEELYEKSVSISLEMDLHMLHLLEKLVVEFPGELEARKEKFNLISYDDLLLILHRSIFAKGGGLVEALRKSYRVALIDEFQDTDNVQWDIFNSLFTGPGQGLFLIGDPKQSIYSFRGADIHAYLRAAKGVKRAYTLKTNFRSTKGFIGAMNHIFDVPAPFIYKEIEALPQKAGGIPDKEPLKITGVSPEPLQLWYMRDKEKSAALPKTDARDQAMEGTAGEISRLLFLGNSGKAKIGKRALRPADIAVLVRKNSEAEDMRHILDQFGVRTVIRTDKNLFESWEAHELLKILRAVDQAGNPAAIRSALVTDLMGKSGADMEAHKPDGEEFAALIRRFKKYREIWRNKNFMYMFQEFLAAENLRERLLRLPEGERRLTNLLHLAEVLHGLCAENPGAEIRILEEGRSTKGSEHPIRLATDEEAVQIVTVHLSKGLEYPIVFCPFLWSAGGSRKRHLLVEPPSSEPPAESTDQAPDAGGPSHNRLLLPIQAQNMLEKYPESDELPITQDEYAKWQLEAVREQLSEELRLTYVAMTRAVYRCYFIWGYINDTFNTAPAWLLHGKNINAGLENDILTELSALLKGSTPDALRNELDQMAEASKGLIRVSDVPEAVSYEHEREAARRAGELDNRSFNRELVPDFRISSYSGLVNRRKNEDDETADFGEDDSGDVPRLFFEEKKRAPVTEKNILTFPGGAGPGVFFHSLMENLDFRAPEAQIRKIAGEFCRKYDYGEWSGVIAQTALNVLNTPLYPDRKDFCLRKISNAARVVELEFYFPLREIQSESFLSDMPDGPDRKILETLPASLPSQNPRGFMTGFVDLIFEFEGKYYLLDWKTNFLGGEPEDYFIERLGQVMKEDSYLLQYYIYLAALDRFLSRRLADYDYDQHMGGVLYLFIRGMNPKRGSEYGIYRDLPRKESIRWFGERLMEFEKAEAHR